MLFEARFQGVMREGVAIVKARSKSRAETIIKLTAKKQHCSEHTLNDLTITEIEADEYIWFDEGAD